MDLRYNRIIYFFGVAKGQESLRNNYLFSALNIPQDMFFISLMYISIMLF